MKDRLRTFGGMLRHRSGALVLGAAALLVAAAVAGAAIPDSDDGEIHACYQKNNGQLRAIDAQAGDTCRPSEVALVWNQEGVQGPSGASGLSGPSGARGPSDAFSRFHDAELAATDLAAPRLLELSVPNGLFATTGTAIVRNAGASVALIECWTMHPSGDFDVARARLAPSGQAGDTETLAMNPVGASTGPPAVIWLDCTDGGADVMVSWMKITSVQVASLTNTPG
jgi:hypothetical protein